MQEKDEEAMRCGDKELEGGRERNCPRGLCIQDLVHREHEQVEVPKRKDERILYHATPLCTSSVER